MMQKIKQKAFADGSGEVTIDLTDGDLHLYQDNTNWIAINRTYVEAFIRKLRKQARKAGVYPKKKPPEGR